MPIAMVVDPTNNFLYVRERRRRARFLDLRSTPARARLAGLSPANQPTGSQPVAMALHPSVNHTGQFLLHVEHVGQHFGLYLEHHQRSNQQSDHRNRTAAPSGMAVQ